MGKHDNMCPQNPTEVCKTEGESIRVVKDNDSRCFAIYNHSFTSVPKKQAKVFRNRQI